MASEQSDPASTIKRLAESYGSIKFGIGVLGKNSYATLAVLGIWAAILFRLSAESRVLSALLFGAGIIATGIYVWWVKRSHAFAVQNPELVMLEGAQFLEYKKWEAEVKGLPALKSQPVPKPPSDQPAIDVDSREPR